MLMIGQEYLRICAMAGAILVLSCGGDSDPAGADPSDPTVASVVVDPEEATLTWLGETLALTAIPQDAEGNVLAGQTISWSSLNDSVASVDASGEVSAVGNGEVAIRATVAGVSGDATITVDQAAAGISLSAQEATFDALGDTLRLLAEVRDSGGSIIEGQTVEWLSSKDNVASVDSAGLLLSVGTGSTEVIASVEAASDTAIVTVQQEPAAIELSEVELTGASVGETIHLSAEVKDRNGFAISDVEVRWAAGDSSKAYPISPGEFVALASDSTSLIATSGEVTGTALLWTDPTTLEWEQLEVGQGGHVCGIASFGSSYCWGHNQRGKLGDGSTEDRTRPTPVRGGHVFAAISVGYTHTCGVSSEGAAYCWGSDDWGNLGTGEGPATATTPVPVSGDLTFTQLTIGETHTCGIDAGGDAYCWGYNGGGQLGDGTNRDRDIPTPVTGGLKFLSVHAGRFFTCGLSVEEAVYCWGEGGTGSLGNGSTSNSNVPVPVDNEGGFVALATGNRHACALSNEGQIWCWGWNNSGQLGREGEDGSVPQLAAGGNEFASVVLGFDSTCARERDGDTSCWGENPGLLGFGTVGSNYEPELLQGGEAFLMTTLAAIHACGLGLDRHAICWGDNRWGSLGDGTFANSESPVGVISP